MAIQTTLTVVSNNLRYGTVNISQGTATGDINREVTVSAEAKPGYKFDGWEDVRTEAKLSKFATVSSNPAPTILAVCGTSFAPSSYQNVARELFNDGIMLYLDDVGTVPAPTGYWGAGNNTYYYWDNNRIPTLQTCTYGTGGSGTSTGGGTTTTTRRVT